MPEVPLAASFNANLYFFFCCRSEAGFKKKACLPLVCQGDDDLMEEAFHVPVLLTDLLENTGFHTPSRRGRKFGIRGPWDSIVNGSKSCCCVAM